MENKGREKAYLRQTFEQAWEYYQRALKDEEICNWDYVILTAANAEQAEIYEQEIAQRKDKNQIPESTEYLVIPDPEGKRVGSGGATLNVLKYLYDRLTHKDDLKKKRILLVHSGGDSKRIPQYSPYGKLFTPIPRLLPNGASSSLFDELIITFSVIPARMSPGCVCVSGDVLLEFNPFGVELQNCDSACISIKANAEKGRNHGVFLADKNGEIQEFLHKKSIEELEKYGAIDDNGFVDIDTGTIYFSYNIIGDLIAMILENEENKFINDVARINLYGDIVYPFASKSTLEKYMNEAAEGKKTEELFDCRRKIWRRLSKYSMKILKLYPAEFIHIGTTNELINIVSTKIDEHKYMNWNRKILTNMAGTTDYTLNTVYVSGSPTIGKNSYIENSYIAEKCTIGENAVISNAKLSNIVIPDNVCISSVKLKNEKYVTRIYSVNDDFKQEEIDKIQFLGTDFQNFIKKYNIDVNLIWPDNSSMWNANIYHICETEEESVASALELYKIIHCQANVSEVEKYFSGARISCQNSFNECNVKSMKDRKEKIEVMVKSIF